MPTGRHGTPPSLYLHRRPRLRLRLRLLPRRRHPTAPTIPTTTFAAATTTPLTLSEAQALGGKTSQAVADCHNELSVLLQGRGEFEQAPPRPTSPHLAPPRPIPPLWSVAISHDPTMTSP